MKEKIKLELSPKDFGTLAELVYVGNWIINSVRLHKDFIKKYDRIYEKIAKAFYKTLTPEEKDNFSCADRCLEDAMTDYIYNYEDKVFNANLADKLADFNYPKDDCLTINQHVSHQYEEALEKNGLAVVSIKVKDFEEKLKAINDIEDVSEAEGNPFCSERMARVEEMCKASRKRFYGDEITPNEDDDSE